MKIIAIIIPNTLIQVQKIVEIHARIISGKSINWFIAIMYMYGTTCRVLACEYQVFVHFGNEHKEIDNSIQSILT